MCQSQFDGHKVCQLLSENLSAPDALTAVSQVLQGSTTEIWAEKTLGAAIHGQQVGHSSSWSCDPPTPAIRWSAEVGEKVGTKDRLVLQAITACDPLQPPLLPRTLPRVLQPITFDMRGRQKARPFGCPLDGRVSRRCLSTHPCDLLPRYLLSSVPRTSHSRA
jgi:hypothetical protein